MSDRIVIIGGGFGGLWAAASAARARADAGMSDEDLDITLISPDPFHTIRVRCYETALSAVRVPLDDVLGPIGVRRLQQRVVKVDPASRSLTGEGEQPETLTYSRLIMAAGSALALPPIAIDGDVFDVDTYDASMRLGAHLARLASAPANTANRAVVVIGGGLVGIELACELPQRLGALLADGSTPRVVLVDRNEIGKEMGEGANIVSESLARAGVETRSGVSVARIDGAGVTLGDGTLIPAATVVMATGMKASPLVKDIGVICDGLGRLPVDAFLQVEGVDGVFAAGDCASAPADDLGHRTVMSCQHARPMGRLAGHNAVCDLLQRPEQRIPFYAPDYVTILDLGPVGALYTEGWERGRVVASGAEAKTIKQTINEKRIYPPHKPDRDAMFAAAAPVIQTRPGVSA